MSWVYSKNSKRHLRTCHPDLRTVMGCAIQFSKVDFGISEGHRSVARQQELFNSLAETGVWLTNCDGIKKRSKHNYKPSLACDVFAYVDGRANYEEANMLEIARCVKFCAAQLGIGIEWGGDWTTRVDMPHFNLLNIY